MEARGTGGAWGRIRSRARFTSREEFMKAMGSKATSWLRKYAAVAASILALWVVFAGLLLADLFPYSPSTPLGWAVLIILGPPAYIVLQAVGEAGVEWVSRKLRGRRQG
jgi:hypothetical protein